MKNLKKVYPCFLLCKMMLCAVLFFAACSDDNEEIQDYLNLSSENQELLTQGLDFADAVSTRQVIFETSMEWEAAVTGTDVESWCSVTPTTGKAGKGIVNVAVTRNDTGKERTASLKITAGTKALGIDIRQSATPQVTPVGLSYDPAEPDADQPLTITFKADAKSPLNGYTGDVYLHIGIVSEGAWLYVPADWDENLDKCKMQSQGDNTWSLSLEPSIREWFASGETPVNQLGIVVRSADGSKKGIEEDSFVEVTDNKYEGFVPGSIKTGSMPAGVQEGINVVDNSTVTLVLYDRDLNGNHKDFAYVVGDFNNWTLSNDEKSQMTRDEASGCWWITLNGLDAAKEYAFQYYVGMQSGETIRMADAYTEKILDPDNDSYIPSSTYPDNMTYPEGGRGIVSTFRIQQDGYAWKVNDFKMQNAAYPVIYELHLRDFTATGDLNGVMEKLSYLKDMGVNAIELMPVQEFDGNDSWGYNPCFFFAMDKAYGTKKMYKEFIDACHGKGMAVILDVVYNHATGNHPFAKLYWDASKNLTAANNPYFNVEAPHPYSVFHDFNHESELVRKFVKRNLQFLLEEYHIDGFRFDLTKGFTQKQSTESTASAYDASRVAILKDYYAAITEVKADAFVILEHFCDTREETELAEAGLHMWRNLNNAYCQTAMGYSSESAFTGMYEAVPAWVGFMESHDEERAGYKQTQWGSGVLKTDLKARMEQLAANAAFCFTVPGPKMLWQFGELGYENSIEENGRTGRKPLHWEYLEDADRKQLHDVYAALINLRNDHPLLFDSSATFSWKVSVSDWNNGRSLSVEAVDGEKLVVVANFTADETSVAFPAATGEWTNYLTKQTETVDAALTLPAHSYKVYINF